MKRKTWLCLFIVLFFGALISVLAVRERPVLEKIDPMIHEKRLLAEPLGNFKIMKKAVEEYFTQPNIASKAGILLQEILKLSETDLQHGHWDTLGVYTSPDFIYIGGCYSNWCYVEANRQGAAYNLYMQYDGKKWVHKRCSTEMTEVGKFICNHLKSDGWEYVEGEK